MSFKTQALRDLVVERLVVAADEIFALFEQTFAEYQLEYQQALQSKLLQDHKYHIQKDSREELQTGDVQTVVVQTEVKPNLECIKYEEEEVPLDLHFPNLNATSEDNISKSTYFQQEPADEHGLGAIRQKYEGEEPDGGDELEEGDETHKGEEPGCSLDMDEEFAPCSYSDTDDSEDWEPALKKKKKRKSKKKSTSLGSHNVIIGLKDKTFSCSICNKGFTEKHYLKVHMRLHSGEKPFRCEPCGLSFTFRQNYNQHNYALHPTIKPYRCQVCNQHFADKSEVIAHKETHKGKNPYKCLNCNRTFTFINNLMAHKMSKKCL